jgi:hypothetical protein
MAQSTKKSRQEGIAVEGIVALQARVTAGQLQAEDLSRLSKLLELLLTLLQMIEHPKLKLRQLRRKSDTPGEAGGLMSGVASKAITQVI